MNYYDYSGIPVSMATNFEIGHDQCRNRVCVCCYRKADRPLSGKDIACIRLYLIENYHVDNPDFPNGICTSCHLELHKKDKNDEYNLKFLVDDYTPKRGLRSAAKCVCRICEVAKMPGVTYQRMFKKKRGRPKKEGTVTPPKSYYKVCSNCFEHIYKGSNHTEASCKNSRRSKVYNIEALVQSPTTLQRVASRVIKDAAGTPLATLGPNEKKCEKATVRKEIFTSEHLFGMQQDLNLSNKQTIVLAQDLRLATGSKTAVEKGFQENIVIHSHVLDDLFEELKISYLRLDKDTKVRENFEQATVVCNDIPRLVDLVLEKRSLENCHSPLIKISIDGGGGFLKFCMSIFDIDNLVSKNKTGLSKKFKDSGVKKVFLIAVAPDVPENYVNVKKIWINLGLHKLDRKFTIATDLKLCNILLGLMSHSSTHPCCWCDIKKGELKRKGKQRTISNLNSLFWEFFEANADKKDAKLYGNVIHPPIISDNLEDSTPVIEVIPPPELHLLIGPVNTLYDGLEKVWPQSQDWLKACNVRKTEYHGGSFAGNDSRALLKKVNRLEELYPANNPNAQKYSVAFNALNEVVGACYGYDLHPDFEGKIKKFTEAYLDLKISVTPKIHAVMHHVSEFCHLTGRGLGPWSEQTGEAIHHDFKQTWKRFTIKDTQCENYGKHILQAVSTYNSQHL